MPLSRIRKAGNPRIPPSAPGEAAMIAATLPGNGEGTPSCGRVAQSIEFLRSGVKTVSYTHLVPGLVVADGVVTVDPNMMTGHAGIFAGGDMVPADRNITIAVGHGKKAARNIDAWLRGTSYIAPPKHAVANFESLNTWYYADAPKTVRPMLDIIRRRSTFEEVQGGLDESCLLYTSRCV